MARLVWLIGFSLAVASCGFGDNRTNQNPGEDCGDGVKDPGEGCDDGNVANGDGCSAQCAVETPNPVCGNGTREVGEACDDGNPTNGDGCSDSCTVESVCGNGTREEGEACDDNNTMSGDGCSPTCQVEQATACGLVPQSGCAANQACDLAAIEDGSTACRAVTVQGTADSRCNVETACSAGFTCVEDTATVSYCMKFCNTTNDCGTGSRCAFGLTNSSGDPLNVKVCSNNCNILAQSGCPTGTGCIGLQATAGDFTDCRVMGNKLDGQACVSTTECLPGSLCVQDGSTATCREYCNTAGANTCGSGWSCIGFSDPLTIGGTTFGACAM